MQTITTHLNSDVDYCLDNGTPFVCGGWMRILFKFPNDELPETVYFVVSETPKRGFTKVSLVEETASDYLSVPKIRVSGRRGIIGVHMALERRLRFIGGVAYVKVQYDWYE